MRGALLRTGGLLLRIGFALAAPAAFRFGRATTERRGAILFFGLALTFTLPRFASATRGFGFGLRGMSFLALRARALPAGERLVAGFRRVDLPAKTRLRDDAARDD